MKRLPPPASASEHDLEEYKEQGQESGNDSPFLGRADRFLQEFADPPIVLKQWSERTNRNSLHEENQATKGRAPRMREMLKFPTGDKVRKFSKDIPKLKKVSLRHVSKNCGVD